MAFVGAFILLVIAVLGMAFMIAMIAAAFRAIHPVEPNASGTKRWVCARCGYPGRGLEGKSCPECGGTFIEVAGIERRRRAEAINALKGASVAILAVGFVTALLFLIRLSG
ncbi:MAG: hypothetical protein AAF586_02135 [Planctomycetota bacterium]